MRRDSRTQPRTKGRTHGAYLVEATVRHRIREVTEVLVEGKLTAAIGAANSTRWLGYHRGTRSRQPPMS